MLEKLKNAIGKKNAPKVDVGEELKKTTKRMILMNPITWIAGLFLIMFLAFVALLISCSTRGGGGSNNSIPITWLEVDETNHILKGLKKEVKTNDFSKYNELFVPKIIKKIAKDAFADTNVSESFMKHIEILSIPKDCILDEIEEGAFKNLPNLSIVNIDGQISKTGKEVFLNDKKMGCFMFAGEHTPFDYSTDLLKGTKFNVDPSVNEGAFIFDDAWTFGAFRDKWKNLFPEDAWQYIGDE